CNGAKSVFHHMLRVGQTECDIETHLLDIKLHHWVVLLEQLQGFLWRRNRVLCSLIQRRHHPAHGLRVLVSKLFCSDQRKSVHIGSEIRVLDDEQILEGETE